MSPYWYWKNGSSINRIDFNSLDQTKHGLVESPDKELHLILSDIARK